MKLGKFSCLLGLGLVIALLAGCFSPVGVTSAATDAVDDASFKVEIAIGQSRSVVGGSADQIKWGGNLYNYLQLVVIDEQGNIVAYDEDRKPNSTAPAANLHIDSIAFGATYKFLLLFGDWPRDYAREVPNGSYVDYVYLPVATPTLLAAGYTEERLAAGTETVMISMWPLVIDTKIQQSGSGAWIAPPLRVIRRSSRE
jgi:hypothetical protein